MKKFNLLIFIVIILILLITITLFVYNIYNKKHSHSNISNQINTIPDDNLYDLRMCGTGNAKQNSNTGKLTAVNYIKKLWKKKKIIVKFMSDKPEYEKGFKNTYKDGIFADKDTNGYEKFYDPFEKLMYNTKDVVSCIIKIVKERIEPITNLEFIFNSPYFTDKSDIRISFIHSKGTYSNIGTNCSNISQDEETMNFSWFDVKTVLHEFGHAIGLAHEHQTPYNNPIIWNEPVLYEWAKKTQNWDPSEVRQQIIIPLNKSLVIGTPFDPYSIMLYFYPKEVIIGGVGTPQNMRLSPIDVLYINYLYPPNYEIDKMKKTPKQFYETVYDENIDHVIDAFSELF